MMGTMKKTQDRSQKLRRAMCGALALTMIAGLGGCGYSSKSLYSTAYKTIAVPIFGNKTFRRDWELRLTEAVDKSIEARTPYKLTPRERADTVLVGEIVDIQESVLTRRFAANLPRETELVVTVNFTWKDARTGRVLMQRKDFMRSATEIPELGERVADAEQLAIERCAQAIVSQLQKDF